MHISYLFLSKKLLPIIIQNLNFLKDIFILKKKKVFVSYSCDFFNVMPTTLLFFLMKIAF